MPLTEISKEMFELTNETISVNLSIKNVTKYQGEVSVRRVEYVDRVTCKKTGCCCYDSFYVKPLNH